MGICDRDGGETCASRIGRLGNNSSVGSAKELHNSVKLRNFPNNSEWKKKMNCARPSAVLFASVTESKLGTTGTVRSQTVYPVGRTKQLLP